MKKKKSFIIIGLGRFGLTVCKELANLTNNIIAVDVEQERIDLVSDIVEQCYVCDCTNKQVLEELGVGKIDHAIVAIGNNLEASILTTMNLKELGVKQVSVRVDEGKYTQLLLRVGADNVVVPEEDFGKSYARSCISDTIMDYYEIDEEHAIEQISIPASFKDNGISLEQISFRKKYAINIVGIIRNDKFFIPFGKDSIQEDDILLVVGSHDKIKEFDSKINKK